MPPRALLFDFDGVIADTENHHIAAWQRTFAAMGWDVPDEVCARAIEVDDRVFLGEVFARKQIDDGDIPGWVQRKQELTLAMMADSPRVYPGVAALIARVRGVARLAVVTTTWRANVKAVLKSAGLFSAFNLIVGKEDVQAVKPDPDGYRLAVESLGLLAEDVVALEDSPTGLTAARRAGVRAIAIGHRLPYGPWVGNAPYLPDFRHTDTVLQTLGWD